MSLQQSAYDNTDQHRQRTRMQQLVTTLHTKNTIAQLLLTLLTGIVTILFVGILLYLIVRGAPALSTRGFFSASGNAAIGAQLFNTFYILILSEIILIPISLAAAIYLVEYARPGLLITGIHFASDTLSGVPSIVLGLFGYAFFSTYCGFGLSRLSGALTLLCLNFPIALRLFEDALSAVPRDQHEGGLAMGGTKWHTIQTVVVPAALSGIVTAIVLTAGKIIGEAAALIFTMGTSNPRNVFTLNPLIGSDNLTINIYNIQSTGNGLPKADADMVSAGSAALLVIILLAINILARYIGDRINRKVTAT